MRIWEDTQRDLQHTIARRIGPARFGRSATVLDADEPSDADCEAAVDDALFLMKTETLRLVEDALSRVETAQYGRCLQCQGEIAPSRLRTLPFATRCVACAPFLGGGIRRDVLGMTEAGHSG